MVKNGGLKKASLYDHFEGLTTDYFGSQITTRGAVSKGYYIGTYRNCRILAALHDLWLHLDQKWKKLHKYLHDVLPDVASIKTAFYPTS